jgi:glycosyltransferase involved in cell wall biosynthesis
MMAAPMYLITTHIPVYVEGDRRYVDDSWYADLLLARDFLAPHFRGIDVLAPRLPRSEAGDAKLHEVDSAGDGTLRVHASSVDLRTRARDWPSAARRWRGELAPLVEQARVVHASVDDPFRPMQLAALRAGFAAKRATVVIGFDMDVWDTLPNKLATMDVKSKAMQVLRTVGMDGWMRLAVRIGSVAMLKEGLVHDRYHRFARNPKLFCHTMHSEEYLIDDAAFEARLASLSTGRPLRLGYFGRFVARKGLEDALRIFAAARGRGVDASYTLIGWGPQQAELERLARELGVAEHVHFPGAVPYGEALHKQLRELDALLFTPVEEDTPRMVYDAYAAGLPLIGTGIPFLTRRVEREGAGELVRIGDVAAGAETLVRLDRRRDHLGALSEKAKAAGRDHTIEHWYGRRVDWTIEAVARHERGLR